MKPEHWIVLELRLDCFKLMQLFTFNLSYAKDIVTVHVKESLLLLFNANQPAIGQIREIMIRFFSTWRVSAIRLMIR